MAWRRACSAATTRKRRRSAWAAGTPAACSTSTTASCAASNRPASSTAGSSSCPTPTRSPRGAARASAWSSPSARCYDVGREVFGMREFWADVEALDNRIEATTQLEMLLEARRLVERATRWLLRNRQRPLDIALTVAEFADGAASLAAALPGLLVDAD